MALSGPLFTHAERACWAYGNTSSFFPVLLCGAGSILEFRESGSRQPQSLHRPGTQHGLRLNSQHGCLQQTRFPQRTALRTHSQIQHTFAKWKQESFFLCLGEFETFLLPSPLPVASCLVFGSGREEIWEPLLASCQRKGGGGSGLLKVGINHPLLFQRPPTI